MDAAWKVYVQDRRFDDDQISNCFLKMKYETVGRFTFDFRAIDGDESYMVVGNTLRIFWGDLHKMDGVIQRVDWDSKQFCYHVYGADIRGFLLDRVNTEPATVSSYTSDVTSQVMFTGCDFPTNIWTGAGESIGKYTFHYKIGIQNTIRITSATNIWRYCVERGTVYDHVNGCLYDATKSWATNQWQGATLRFVSGACKNNVYTICGNSSTKVCIRTATATCMQTATGDECAKYYDFGTRTFYNIIENPFLEIQPDDSWSFATTSTSGVAGFDSPGYNSDTCIYLNSGGGYRYVRSYATQTIGATVYKDTPLQFRYRYRVTGELSGVGGQVTFEKYAHSYTNTSALDALATTNPAWPEFDVATVNTDVNYGGGNSTVTFIAVGFKSNTYELWVDNVYLGVATGDNPCGDATGVLPGCARRGDIYEIVTATLERIEPQPIIPATLEKDSHIIRYNRVNSLSDHVTSMTVRGA